MSVPGALRDLVDPTAVTAQLRRSGLDIVDAQPDYVRYKPAATTIVGLVLRTSDGSRERGYARWCAQRARLDDIERKAYSRQPKVSGTGLATTRVDSQTIFSPFPNDARLRQLRWYTTPRKWKRTLAPLVGPDAQLSGSLSTVEILRYKPERRVVVAAHLMTTSGDRRSVLIRYATAKQAPVAAGIATALARCGVDTPRPLLQLEDGHVSVDEYLRAIDLHVAVRAGDIDPDAVSGAIAKLHAAPIVFRRRDSSDRLRQIGSGLRGLATWSEPTRRPAQALLCELSRTLPTSDDDVFLHGDLHDGNIMVRPNGEVAFVDLDRVARGSPAIDLGRLRAAAVAIGVRDGRSGARARVFAEDVIARYRRHQLRPTGDRDLAWHSAVALGEHALLAARHVEPGWEESVDRLLAAAHALLQCGSSA